MPKREGAYDRWIGHAEKIHEKLDLDSKIKKSQDGELTPGLADEAMRLTLDNMENVPGETPRERLERKGLAPQSPHRSSSGETPIFTQGEPDVNLKRWEVIGHETDEPTRQSNTAAVLERGEHPEKPFASTRNGANARKSHSGRSKPWFPNNETLAKQRALRRAKVNHPRNSPEEQLLEE